MTAKEYRSSQLYWLEKEMGLDKVKDLAKRKGYRKITADEAGTCGFECYHSQHGKVKIVDWAVDRYKQLSTVVITQDNYTFHRDILYTERG